MAVFVEVLYFTGSAVLLLFVSVKAKRQYEKSHRESEKALEVYRKSDADIHLSRADVEKVSTLSRSFVSFAFAKEIVHPFKSNQFISEMANL